jgi:hypothetical protein
VCLLVISCSLCKSKDCCHKKPRTKTHIIKCERKEGGDKELIHKSDAAASRVRDDENRNNAARIRPAEEISPMSASLIFPGPCVNARSAPSRVKPHTNKINTQHMFWQVEHHFGGEPENSSSLRHTLKNDNKQ